MLVYWSMFAVPALSSIVLRARGEFDRNRGGLGMIFLVLLFTVLIGLRYQVGTDWYNYQDMVNRISYVSFSGALGYKDPGFGALAWVSTRLGFSFYGPNCVCAAILMYGLTKFVQQQADKWLAVTASVPYLLIVVGMGYVRQAAAIGFVLLAILAFERRSFYSFIGWVAAAAVFHGSSLCILPLAGLAIVRDRKALLIPLALVTLIFYFLVVRSRATVFYSMYVDRQAAFDSSGALIRLMMNAVPATLFLIYRHRFSLGDTSRFLWMLFSFCALAMIGVLFVFPSSTAVDRIGLYFIPIQILVFGNLPGALGKSAASERIFSYLVVLYYGAVLFVWLNFASNAKSWLPYHFLPFA